MASTTDRLNSLWKNYIAADEAFDGKLERLHGEIFAMAGGTAAHALLIGNMQAHLHGRLRGTPCRSTSSKQRILLPNNDAAYADATVWCGPADLRPDHTLTNPTLVVEVLSPSNANWDRTGKLDLYRGIPSLKHVLLVAHDAWHLTLVSRREDGSWSYETAGPGESVRLDAIGVTLSVDEVYEGMDAVGGPARTARHGRPLGEWRAPVRIAADFDAALDPQDFLEGR